MTPETAKKVAHWWATQLDDKHAALRLAFERALERRLLETNQSESERTYLAEHPDCLERHCDVDYDPCDVMVEALSDVGIPCRGFLYSAKDIFPYKTRMWIRADGRVEVACGYAADREVLP